jgi:hypothetical protein
MSCARDEENRSNPREKEHVDKGLSFPVVILGVHVKTVFDEVAFLSNLTLSSKTYVEMTVLVAVES